MSDLSIEFMKSIPSLGWVRRLPKQKVAQILARFSARDLATAWIGPESVLETMTKEMPAKKIE